MLIRDQNRSAPLDPKLNLARRITEFELGQMDEDQVISFFQDLIDTSLAWQLQRSYGRAAARLIEDGECHA